MEEWGIVNLALLTEEECKILTHLKGEYEVYNFGISLMDRIAGFKSFTLCRYVGENDSSNLVTLFD